MSFSNPEVRKLLRGFFVCTWKDIEGDPGSQSSPRIEEDGPPIPLMRGSGFANLQILVLTPDARLLHAVSGKIEGSDLAWELSQALITYEKTKARPKLARRIVAGRQDRIHSQYLGERKTQPLKLQTFGIRTSSNKGGRFIPDIRERHVRGDRAITKKHALAPVHAVKAAWFTRDRSGGGFSGNQVLDMRRGPMKRLGKIMRKAQREEALTPPWQDMSPALRTRYARALGIAPPRPPPKAEAMRRGSKP